MNQKLKPLIPALVLLPMCLNAITYTADPGAVAIDIDGGATFDSTAGAFNSSAQFYGSGDLTILANGSEVDLVGNSSFTGNVYSNSSIDIYNSGSLGADTNTLYLNSNMNVRATTTHAQAIIIKKDGLRIQPARTGITTTLSGNITFDGDHLFHIGSGFNVADRNITFTGNITDGAHTNGRIQIDGDNSLFTFSGDNNYNGLTTVKDVGTILKIDGTHTGGSLLVESGATLGGEGTIVFQDTMIITNNGTLDLTSLKFDVSKLQYSGSAFTLVDFSNGSLLGAPTDLQDILDNSPNWRITNNGSRLSVLIPESNKYSMITGGIALIVVFLRRRM